MNTGTTEDITKTSFPVDEAGLKLFSQKFKADTTVDTPSSINENIDSVYNVYLTAVSNINSLIDVITLLNPDSGIPDKLILVDRPTIGTFESFKENTSKPTFKYGIFLRRAYNEYRKINSL